MPNIFLSHSQMDVEIINIFQNAFQNTKVKYTLMEFEKYTNPPWQYIKSKIQTSSAVFVLLGPNLKSSDYTQNWVSYEVGLADALNKPIWIFEDNFNKIHFPIPKADHYLIYDTNDPKSLENLQNVISSYAINAKAALGGIILAAALTTNPLGLISAGLIGSKIGVPERPKGISLQCYYSDCRVYFQFYNSNKDFLCPSCRRPLRVVNH